MRNRMKSARLYTIFWVAVLLGSAFSSCDHTPERKTTFAVVPKVDDASVALAKAAALAARERYDVAVRWDVSYRPTAASQAELIDKLVQAGVDGILLSCIDASDAELREAIDAAVAAGVFVGTFDSDAPGSARSFYIGSDQTAAGELAAVTLRELCTEGGRAATGIGLFGGVEGDAAMAQRLAGFLPEVPDTAALLWSGDVPATGRKQATDFLTDEAQLPINGVVFLSGTTLAEANSIGGMARLDSLCRAATEAEEGAAAAAVFFDPTNDVLEFVHRMPHCAAIRQDYPVMVNGGIERLLRLVRGEGNGGGEVVYTPVEVIR